MEAAEGIPRCENVQDIHVPQESFEVRLLGLKVYEKAWSLMFF
jgi:hypothetical protein